MKKSIKVTLGAVVLTGVFTLGVFTSSKIDAATSWSSSVLNNANAKLGKAGYEKTQQILARDIGQAVIGEFDDTLSEEERQLELLLEEYYRLKVAGLTDGEEFKNIENQIGTVREQIFNRYKGDIDKLFK